MLSKPTPHSPNNFLVWALGGILFLTPFLRWETLFDAVALPRYAFIGISSCLLLIVWLFVRFRNSHSIIYHPLIFLLLAYLVWAGISYLWSVDPAATSKSLLYMAAFLILVFLTAQVATSTDKIKILLLASVSAGSLISLLGLLQVLGFEPFNIQQPIPPASTFGNRNLAAQYLDLIIPISLMLFLTATKPRWYWLLSVALGLNTAYLLNTYSRGSWLALIVICLILIYLLIKNPPARAMLLARIKQRKLAIMIAILIPIAFLVLPGIKDDTRAARPPQLESKLTVDSAVHIRLKAMANTPAAIAANPATGVGHGAFMLGFREYMFANAPLTEATESKYLVNLHNDFLQEFVELGVVGGVLFLSLYLWLLFRVWQITIHAAETTRLYSIGILLALLAIGVHALVSFPFHLPTSALEFWVLAGIVMGIEGKKITLSKRLAYIATGVILFSASLLLSYMGYYYLRYFHNSAQVLRLKQELTNQNCAPALNIASQLDFPQSYATKIYVPMAYNACYATDPQGSFEKMNAILAYDPNNSLARITRGTLFLKMNRPRDAANDFLNVTEILPHRPTAYIGLGHAAVTMGKIPLARDMYHKALAVDKDNAVAREMLEKLKSLP